MKPQGYGFLMMFSIVLAFYCICGSNIGFAAASVIFGGIVFFLVWIFIATGLLITGDWDEVKRPFKDFFAMFRKD